MKERANPTWEAHAQYLSYNLSVTILMKRCLLSRNDEQKNYRYNGKEGGDKGNGKQTQKRDSVAPIRRGVQGRSHPVGDKTGPSKHRGCRGAWYLHRHPVRLKVAGVQTGQADRQNRDRRIRLFYTQGLLIKKEPLLKRFFWLPLSGSNRRPCG